MKRGPDGRYYTIPVGRHPIVAEISASGDLGRSAVVYRAEDHGKAVNVVEPMSPADLHLAHQSGKLDVSDAHREIIDRALQAQAKTFAQTPRRAAGVKPEPPKRSRGMSR